MKDNRSELIPSLYQRFASPISAMDCGERCAPHNERGIPFCCDLNHAVPSAYRPEWIYLQENTDLWHLWRGETGQEPKDLENQVPENQVLIACKGVQYCQREYRSFTCRSFPFYPYFTSKHVFIGLSYYWEYEDRCWVISNLATVSQRYLQEFILAYDYLLREVPGEKENFIFQSGEARKVFFRRKRAIPLLHRNGKWYKISPGNERLRRIPVSQLPVFGVFRIVVDLPFPDGT